MRRRSTGVAAGFAVLLLASSCQRLGAWWESLERGAAERREAAGEQTAESGAAREGGWWLYDVDGSLPPGLEDAYDELVLVEGATSGGVVESVGDRVVSESSGFYVGRGRKAAAVATTGGSRGPTTGAGPGTPGPQAGGGSRATTGGFRRRGGAAEGFECWELWFEHRQAELLAPPLRDARARRGGRESERSTRVVPGLRALLGDSDPMVVWQAARALGAVTPPELAADVAKDLLAVLSNSPPVLQGALVLGLGALDHAPAAETLREILNDTTRGRRSLGSSPVPAPTRALAAAALGMLGDSASIDDLIAATELESERDVAALAVLALGGMRERHETIVDHLFEVLEGRQVDRIVRAQAPIALARLHERGSTEVAPHLDDLEKLFARTTTDLDRRRSLALALGRIATLEHKGIVEELQDTVERNNDDQTRHFSLIALARIGARDQAFSHHLRQHQKLLEFLLREANKPKRITHQPWAALALGLYLRDLGWQEGREEAGQALLKALGSVNNPSAQGALALSLGLLRHGPAVPVLADVLKNSTDADLRSYTALALGLQGGAEARTAVLGQLKQSASPSQHGRVLLALGLLGPADLAQLDAALQSAQSFEEALAAARAVSLQDDGRVTARQLAAGLGPAADPWHRSLAALAAEETWGRDVPSPYLAFAVDINYRAKVAVLAEIIEPVLPGFLGIAQTIAPNRHGAGDVLSMHAYRFPLPGAGSARRTAPQQQGQQESVEKPLQPLSTDVSEGSLLATGEDGITRAFPLQHTDVQAEIAGFLAKTGVRQSFANPYAEAIEAVYVFPLPTDAAIHHFEMQIGERRILGLIRPRAEAERIYVAARERGQTASLLQQERPNVFTQSVANIAPGASVDVVLTFFQTLAQENGAFEYHFPMVVAPRYTPGGAPPPVQPLAQGNRHLAGGGGVAADNARVPDASRVTPPLYDEGVRSGHDISLQVRLTAGVPIHRIEVPTHDVALERPGPAQAAVKLAAHDTIPNKDFVLRYSLGGEGLKSAVLVHRTEKHGGFFSLLVVPPLDPADAEVTPREITFIMDTSGSMRGIPIEKSKEVVRRTLQSLRPLDHFNIVNFAGGSGRLAEQLLANTPENVQRGLDYLQGFQGSGGTEMMRGVREYLDAPAAEGYLRIVCFLTDGLVSNEKEILRTIREEGQEVRWFGFGIGNSVNRMLIEGLGREGNGSSHVVLTQESAAVAKAVDRFYACIDSPVLTHIELDTGGLALEGLHPQRPHDLFAGQTLAVVGRYTTPADGVLTVRGRVGSRRVEIPVQVSLPAAEPRNAALRPVWARQRIAELERARLTRPDDAELTEAITEVALEHRLLTQFTSFVAVDTSRVVGDGRPRRVLQPVELPAGMSREGLGSFTLRQGTTAWKIERWGLHLGEDDSGCLRVVHVEPGGPAERDGQLEVGDEVVRLGRTDLDIHDQLEKILEDARGELLNVGVRRQSGGEDTGGVREVLLPNPKQKMP